MSDSTNKLIERFLAQPRAIQWAVLAALGVVIFLAWDSWIGPWQEQLSRDADNIESQVREVRDSRKLAEELRKPDMEAVVVGVGAVRAPRNAAAGSSAFTGVVNQLMKQHAITDQDFSLRTRGKLPKNVLVQVLGGKRAERLTGDLKFSAKPDVALAILNELESSPDIEQVSSVRLTKDQGGKVKAHYVVEAWIVASDGSSTAGGSSL